MRNFAWWRLVGVGVVAAATAATSSSALGDGSCGQDYTNATACPVVGTSETFSGQIVAADDTDHYVFYAHADTHVSFAFTDLTDLTACGSNCPVDAVTVVSSSGQTLAEGDTNPYQGEMTATNGYITKQAGIYYVDVAVEMGYWNGTPVPYTLIVSGDPALSWPAPPPPAPAPVPASSSGSGTATITAPKTSHPGRQLNVNVMLWWTYHKQSTRLTKMRFSVLPARARIRATGTGGGSGRSARRPWTLTSTSRSASVAKLVKALEARRYTAGERLTLAITAPGETAEGAEFRFRDGALPVRKLLKS